jgi:hypothetical protein
MSNQSYSSAGKASSLSERALDATQLLPTRLLFPGAALRLDDLDQLGSSGCGAPHKVM